jgi:Monooxygenase af470-like
MKIHAGRFTADTDDDFVVFLIGMRVNKPWKINKCLPIAMRMGVMQRQLMQRPELGCLGIQNFGGRTSLSLQYWRSFEDLDRYAKDPDLAHLQPWRAFNKEVRDSGDVGIWHETYHVAAGEYEAVYGNMPTFGLAAATAHGRVGSRGQTAAARIGQVETDIPAVPGY